MSVPPLPGFVYLRSFERAATGAMSDADRRELERKLIENPEAGDTMKETGGIRKLRFGRIYMLRLYSKNVQDNVTKQERNAMKALTAQLDREA